MTRTTTCLFGLAFAIALPRVALADSQTQVFGDTSATCPNKEEHPVDYGVWRADYLKNLKACLDAIAPDENGANPEVDALTAAARKDCCGTELMTPIGTPTCAQLDTEGNPDKKGDDKKPTSAVGLVFLYECGGSCTKGGAKLPGYSACATTPEDDDYSGLACFADPAFGDTTCVEGPDGAVTCSFTTTLPHLIELQEAYYEDPAPVITEVVFVTATPAPGAEVPVDEEPELACLAWSAPEPLACMDVYYGGETTYCTATEDEPAPPPAP